MIKIGYELFEVTDDIFMKMLFAGVRFFIAGLLLLLLNTVKNRCFPTFPVKKLPNVLSVAVVYTSLQYFFFYVGLSNITGSLGSIINSSSVFMAVVICHFVYKDDKISPLKLLDTALGLFGVFFAVLSEGALQGSFSLMGEGLMLLAALSSVIGSILNKKTTETLNSSTLAAYNLLFGGLLLIILGAAFTSAPLTTTPKGIAVLLYLSCVSAFGYTVQSGLFKDYSISAVSVYNFIIPLSGAVFSALFLGENILRWEYLMSLVFTALGIITVNLNSRRSH